ncbi:MAG TPA: hypothetical protein PK358_03850 [Spirochaetota bacterium]|mgnify:CR=1 FL=1|nr:hypothetical protein [Spirochaetota bacterium]HPJ33941.1 hypothetical protein [Spirochaetota bacterium]
MGNELETAATNFSEQAKKLQIALYYTHNDEEKSKKMLNDTYRDLVVLKGRFSSASVYGAFIIFVNSVYLKVVNSFFIVSRSFELADLKTSIDWRNFEKQLDDVQKKGGGDDIFAAQVKENIARNLNFQELTKLFKLIELNDAIAVNHSFQKFLSDVTGFQNIELSLDYETSTSLAMEIHSITGAKIPPAELARGQGEEKAAQEVKIEKVDDSLEGKEIKLMLNGALILSPIKGKDIAKLTIGDRIMISIIDKNPRAVDVAKAFNAYDSEGKIKPIPGRIVSIKRDDCLHVMAIVAKGIYMKIVEEEDNIKVAMDPTYFNQSGKTDADESGNSRTMLIILSVVFLLLIGIVLFFVFKA